VTLTGQFGGWAPEAPDGAFDPRPYGKLTFALKPTLAGQDWSCFVQAYSGMKVSAVDVLDYGPAPTPGVWGVYTIPLSALGVGASIYKFSIQDQTALSRNVWYVDDVGFLP
jgi:hypothetical protein